MAMTDHTRDAALVRQVASDVRNGIASPLAADLLESLSVALAEQDRLSSLMNFDVVAALDRVQALRSRLSDLEAERKRLGALYDERGSVLLERTQRIADLEVQAVALRPFQSKWLEMSRERDALRLRISDLEAENKRLTEEQDEDYEVITQYVAQLIKERNEWIQVANIGIPKSKRRGGGPQHG